MRVGIDVHVLGDREEGTGRVWRSLLRALPARHEYVLYSFNPRLTHDLFPQAHFRHRRIPVRQPHLRIQFAYPLLARRDRCNAFHANYVGPWWGVSRLVLTVHDVIWLDYPEFAPPGGTWRTRWLGAASARAAARIITVSSYSKERILHHFGVAEEDVDVVHTGLGEEWRAQPGDIDSAWQRVRRRLPGRYILTVGRWDPRKNFPLVARVVAELTRAGLTDGLVIVGPDDFGSGEATAQLRRDGTARLVTRLSGLEVRELQAVYRHAQCLLYLSLAEGFGLPLLEAMAMDTPVVAAARTALPEICGDAAIMVSGTDLGDALNGVRAVIENETVAQTLRRKGRERVRTFSTEQMGAQVAAAYERATEGSHGGRSP